MTRMCEIHCWEITQCSRATECVARKNPDTPCWEIACELKSYQEKFNICRDCIVYLSKKKNEVLSHDELVNILAKKAPEPVLQKYPAFFNEQQLNV